MSLANQILSDVDDVFLNLDDFAETIIRYIGGDVGNISSFTGIVTVEQTQVNDGRGRGFDHMASLVLSSDVTIAVGDAIKHGDERYEVKTVGDPEHGMRTCHLVRYQPEVKGGKIFRNGDL